MNPPPPPPNPLQPLVIDLTVNAVASPTAETGSTGPGGSGGITTQTVTVNGVPVAPSSGDGNGGAGATTQSVVVNVPPPPTTGGGSGGDVVVVLDREKTVEKPAGPACRGAKNRCGRGKPRPPCANGDEPEGGTKPRKKAVKLGHVEFEHGSRRFVPSHPDRIGGILEALVLLKGRHLPPGGETRRA